jgi:hypothetical protein
MLLLALLVFRAYVPVGFMPASGTPFLLELCPAAMGEGMPAGHVHHHGGSHADFESCPFGSAPAGAPISQHIEFNSAGPLRVQLILAPPPAAPLEPWLFSHQPRGPPVTA